jgi:hypothetical protein
MDKIDEILAHNSIPEDIKITINSLSKDGREVLNSMYDKDSDFYKHAQLNNIIARFFADPKEYDKLYHYTNREGLKGILQSHTFYIGSQYFMNDPRENIYVSELAEKILKKEESASFQEINDFKNDFRRVKFDLYIWSFTANDHSQALLNYGDFALEFENQELQKKLSNYFNPNINDFSKFNHGNCYIFPLKVEYDRKIQEEYIGSVIHTWLGAYRNLEIDPNDMDEIINVCYCALNLFAMCFKDPNLRQEEEIRFVILKQDEDNKLHPDQYIGDNHKPVLLFEFQSDLLKKIIYSKKIKDAEKIKELLNTNDYKNTKVVSTDLPY